MIILGILLFILLVVIHELGHFMVARRNGVEVEEFGLGFPPRLYGRKAKSDTLYSINLLPLGGFVRLKGENDADTRPGSFGAASFTAKAKITLAGVAVNFLAAIVIFTILAASGMPKLIEGQFSAGQGEQVVRQGVIAAIVDQGSPAAEAGVEVGDRILALGDQSVSSSDQLIEVAKSQAGQRIEVVYEHQGQQLTRPLMLRPSDSKDGFLGIGPADDVITRYGLASPLVGVGTTAQFSWLTLKGLGAAVLNLVTGDFKQAAGSVSGPVGIFVILQNVTAFGWQYLLSLIGIISLTLAIINALPIPALDGGRLALMALFRALKKPLTPKLEERIHSTGFALLLMLILVVTIVDVKRFF